jgi:hypothetical protein
MISSFGSIELSLFSVLNTKEKELKTPITKSLQKNPRLTIYPTMYHSKKSYIMLSIDLGRTIERPSQPFYFSLFIMLISV